MLGRSGNWRSPECTSQAFRWANEASLYQRQLTFIGKYYWLPICIAHNSEMTDPTHNLSSLGAVSEILRLELAQVGRRVRSPNAHKLLGVVFRWNVSEQNSHIRVLRSSEDTTGTRNPSVFCFHSINTKPRQQGARFCDKLALSIRVIVRKKPLLLKNQFAVWQ